MLSKLKSLVAGAIDIVGGQFAKAASAIADLAASLANRAAAAADLGRILDIIEMVPGASMDKPKADADYLNTLLVAMQMGELTLAVHYRREPKPASYACIPSRRSKPMHWPPAKADLPPKFSSTVKATDLPSRC